MKGVMSIIAKVAFSVVVAALVVAALMGVHFLAEAWLILPIVLEPFVGSFAAGILALVPIAALVYLFVYALKEA